MVSINIKLTFHYSQPVEILLYFQDCLQSAACSWEGSGGVHYRIIIGVPLSVGQFHWACLTASGNEAWMPRNAFDSAMLEFWVYDVIYPKAYFVSLPFPSILKPSLMLIFQGASTQQSKTLYSRKCVSTDVSDEGLEVVESVVNPDSPEASVDGKRDGK